MLLSTKTGHKISPGCDAGGVTWLQGSTADLDCFKNEFGFLAFQALGAVYGRFIFFFLFESNDLKTKKEKYYLTNGWLWFNHLSTCMLEETVRALFFYVRIFNCPAPFFKKITIWASLLNPLCLLERKYIYWVLCIYISSKLTNNLIWVSCLYNSVWFLN